MELPDYINTEIWTDWIEMRNEKKYPVTDRVKRAAIRNLQRFHVDGHDVNVILDNAIQGGWQGLFTGDNTQRKRRPASHGHGPEIAAPTVDRENGRHHLRMVRGAVK